VEKTEVKKGKWFSFKKIDTVFGIHIKYFFPMALIVIIASEFGILTEGFMGSFAFLMAVGGMLSWIGVITPIIREIGGFLFMPLFGALILYKAGLVFFIAAPCMTGGSSGAIATLPALYSSILGKDVSSLGGTMMTDTMEQLVDKVNTVVTDNVIRSLTSESASQREEEATSTEPKPRDIVFNGVMAGCRPEYMPVLIAVIEAISEPISATMLVHSSKVSLVIAGSPSNS